MLLQLQLCWEGTKAHVLAGAAWHEATVHCKSLFHGKPKPRTFISSTRPPPSTRRPVAAQQAPARLHPSPPWLPVTQPSCGSTPRPWTPPPSGRGEEQGASRPPPPQPPPPPAPRRSGAAAACASLLSLLPTANCPCWPAGPRRPSAWASSPTSRAQAQHLGLRCARAGTLAFPLLLTPSHTLPPQTWALPRRWEL